MGRLPGAVIQLVKTTVLLVTSPVFETGPRPIKIQSISIDPGSDQYVSPVCCTVLSSRRRRSQPSNDTPKVRRSKYL